jgi:hypothetical protein
VAEAPELPVSPELVLVSDSEDARAARERLPEMPVAPARAPEERPSDSEWELFLAKARARQVAAEEAPSAVTPVPRRRRRRVILAVAVLVAVAAAAVVVVRIRAGNETQPARVQSSTPPEQTVTATTDAKPTTRTSAARSERKPKAAPPAAGKFRPARTWSWAAVRGADAYVVRFFRNGDKVLQARTARPRYTVPKRFVFRPGRYRWTVAPIGVRPGSLLVDSAFVVS